MSVAFNKEARVRTRMAIGSLLRNPVFRREGLPEAGRELIEALVIMHMNATEIMDRAGEIKSAKSGILFDMNLKDPAQEDFFVIDRETAGMLSTATETRLYSEEKLKGIGLTEEDIEYVFYSPI